MKDGNKSIKEELNGFSRTYFLERINMNDEIDCLGFVTIRIFNLDISNVDIKWSRIHSEIIDRVVKAYVNGFTKVLVGVGGR